MSFYSETYKGYTITCVASAWRISGLASVHFLSLEAARRYIDKLES